MALLRYFALLALVPLANAQFHPADTNQDRAITLEEIEAYWKAGLGGLSETQKRADPAWQQADHLWRSGGDYIVENSLPEPFAFLPDLPAAQSSLSNRWPQMLSVIEILSPDGSVSSATAEFRPFGGDNWFSLEVSIDASGRASFLVPYLPTYWFENSRRIEIRATLDGVDHACGQIDLRPVDRDRFNFETFFEQMLITYEGMAATQGIDLDAATATVEGGGNVSSEAAVFVAARLAAEYQRDILRTMRQSDSGTARAMAAINEEIFVLLFDDRDIAELERQTSTSAIPRAAVIAYDEGAFSAGDLRSMAHSVNDGSACPRIRDAGDLELESQERCRLENKKSVLEQIQEALGNEDQVEEAYGKVSDKLTEISEKSAKKLVSGSDRASNALRSLPFFAVKASYELYNFKEEWNKQQLPAVITELVYEPKDAQNGGDRGYLYEDSPFASNECNLVELEVYAKVAGRGFDTFEFAAEKLPSASDSLPGSVANVPGLSDALSELIDNAQKQALERAHEQIGDDIRFEPCIYPSDGSRGIKLEDEKHFFLETIPGSSIEADAPDNPFFKAAGLGTGLLNVVIQHDDPQRLCLDPYTGQFAYEVRPIRVEFEPPIKSINDVDQTATITVNLEDSYETETLQWNCYDRQGRYLDAFRENDGTETLAIENYETQSNNKTHTLTFNPPDDLDLYPLTFRAESKADGCLRRTASTERVGYAKLHYRAKVFTIIPNRTCLARDGLHELQAVAADEATELDVEWEVTSGNATVERLTPTTALLEFTGDAAGEVEVKATGNDTFTTYAYFTASPCFETVTFQSQFDPALHTQTQVGNRYETQNSVIWLGSLDGFASGSSATLLQSLQSGGSFNIDFTFAAGVAVVDIEELEAAENGARQSKVRIQGYYWPLLDLSRPLGKPFEVEEDEGGTYYTDYRGQDPDELDSLRFAPVKWDFSDDLSTVQVTLEHGLEADFTGEFNPASISGSWTILNGTKVDERREDDSLIVVAEFSVFETNPRISLRLTGSVTLDEKTYSVDYWNEATFESIIAQGEATYKYRSGDGDVVVCGNWGGRLNAELDYLLDGCCGILELFNNDRYTGSARLDFVNSITLLGGSIPQAGLVAGFGTDEEIPYCREIERLREEIPNPEPPPPGPDDPDDPGDPNPTPDEISDSFKNTPVPDPNAPRLPDPDGPTVVQGSSSAGVILSQPSSVSYPVREFNLGGFPPYPNGIELAAFDPNTGAFLRKTPFVSANALAYLAENYHVIMAGRASANSTEGIFVERNFGDERYLDFWAYDAADGLLTGSTLIETGDRRVLAVGDFDGDGDNDALAVAPGPFGLGNGALEIYQGDGSGISETADTFFANADGALLRAAAALSGGHGFLARTDINTDVVEIVRLDSAGNISSGSTLPEGSQVQAFADFDADGIPDAVTHGFTAPSFVVHYLNANGTVRSTQTFTIPANHLLPGYPFF